MPNFATLDLHSGYIWWSGEADTPVDACVMSHACTGGYHSTEWAAVSRSDANTGSGYAVYRIPETMALDDGRDADTIEAVTACPLAGYFQRTSSEA